MSERLSRQTPHAQQTDKPEFKGGDNNSAPHSPCHSDSEGGGCKDGQPNHYVAGFGHGQNSSTVATENPKALPHVVTALIAKRAELAGQIEHLQGQIRQATVALDNVESTIRLFAPEIDLAGIAPRAVPPAHHAFRGEVSRILLESLRKAIAPMSTTALTECVMRERGLDLNDLTLKRTMGRRVGASLNHWRRIRGVVRSMPGPGQVLLWEVVR